MLDVARRLMDKARARGTEIPLPTDVVVAKEFAATAHADVRAVQRGAPRRDDSRHRPGHAPIVARELLRSPAPSSGTGR